MDPTCLSAAAVLRCSSLTKEQNIAFVFPVVVEFLASCLLISLKWGSGKQHFLLVAEAWVYLILVLVELASAFPSLSIDNVDRFRSFDIGIGITSFFPLFFHILFLFIFTWKELFADLPKYVVNVAKVFMVLSLPVIIGLNEVASVTGMTIIFDEGGTPSFSFSNKRDEWLWQFLTALTLAVLTAFQVTVFSLSLCRLLWIRVEQQRGKHDVRIGGIGWIIAGVKLGVLEAIIGFVGGRFEVSMTRRVMRLLGRACLYIGIIIGVGTVKDTPRRPYDNLERHNKNDVTRSKLHRPPPHLKISNPRFSTFQHLSPMAAGFHSTLRGPSALQTPSSTTVGARSPHYLTFSQRQGLMLRVKGGLPAQFPSLQETSADQRVTVFYDVEGGPPLLQMRFSVLDVPLTPVCPLTPEQVNASTKLRFAEPTRIPSRTPPPPFDDVLPLPKAAFAQEGQKSRTPGGSLSSLPGSIVEIVDLPRRTISQRRAEARIFHARVEQVEKQVEKQDSDTRSSFCRESSQSSLADGPAPRLYRPPTPGPLSSMSRSSHHATCSLRSVSDSIQAVQELASQFPALPTSISLEHSSDFARPAPPAYERSVASNRDSGPFILAIGSPADLGGDCRLSRSPSEAQISRDETTSPGNQGSGQLPEEGIVSPLRQEYWCAQTPSSGQFSIITIKQQPIALVDAVSPLVSTPRQGQSRSPELDNSPVSKPAGDAMLISEWVDNPFDETVVHERIPQGVDDRGGTPVHSRPFSVMIAGPSAIENVPAESTGTGLSTVNVKEQRVSAVKPIVIPRRKPGLPKAIQCWDDDP